MTTSSPRASAVIKFACVGLALTGLGAALGGCQKGTSSASSANMTAAELAAAEAGITVISATVPGAAQVLADGQLLCQAGSEVVAVVDAITQKPWLVTGKPAAAVEQACLLVGGQFKPVAPPTSPATVPAVTVVTRA